MQLNRDELKLVSELMKSGGVERIDLIYPPEMIDDLISRGAVIVSGDLLTTNVGKL